MYIYINVDVCTSILIWVRVIRINATFNNISVIPRRFQGICRNNCTYTYLPLYGRENFKFSLLFVQGRKVISSNKFSIG